jgi:hypothetical protein
MFQLKHRLEQIKVSKTHDSLFVASSVTEGSCINTNNETDMLGSDFLPKPIVMNEDDGVDDQAVLVEGPGDHDKLKLDVDGICNGNPEAGNRKVFTQFG